MLFCENCEYCEYCEYCVYFRAIRWLFYFILQVFVLLSICLCYSLSMSSFDCLCYYLNVLLFFECLRSSLKLLLFSEYFFYSLSICVIIRLFVLFSECLCYSVSVYNILLLILLFSECCCHSLSFFFCYSLDVLLLFECWLCLTCSAHQHNVLFVGKSRAGFQSRRPKHSLTETHMTIMMTSGVLFVCHALIVFFFRDVWQLLWTLSWRDTLTGISLRVVWNFP